MLQLILNAICLWYIIEEGTWILFHLGVKRYIMHAEFGFIIGISISIKFWCLDSHFRLTWIKTWGVGVDRCMNCGLAVYLVNHLVQSLIIIDFRYWWLKLVCIYFRLIKCWRGLVILDIKSLNDLLSLLFELICFSWIIISLFFLHGLLTFTLLPLQVEITYLCFYLVLKLRFRISFGIYSFKICLYCNIRLPILILIGFGLSLILIKFRLPFRFDCIVIVFSFLLKLIGAWLTLGIYILIEYNRLCCMRILFFRINVRLCFRLFLLIVAFGSHRRSSMIPLLIIMLYILFRL